MQKGVQSKIRNRMANSVDPDKKAHNEPSIWIYTVWKGTDVGLLDETG